VLQTESNLRHPKPWG